MVTIKKEGKQGKTNLEDNRLTAQGLLCVRGGGGGDDSGDGIIGRGK